MGIQDDIFDIEDRVKNTPEAESFERVITYLGNLEKQLEQHREFYYAASELRRVSKKIDKWTKK